MSTPVGWGKVDAADRATIRRMRAQFPELGDDTIYRSITCRSLATVEVTVRRWGRSRRRSVTGCYLPDGLTGRGWVTTPDGRHRYGERVADHGTIWPEHELYVP